MTSIEMTLIVEQQVAMDVLNAMVKGFGVGRIVETWTVDEALTGMNISPVDIILVDCAGTPGGNDAIVRRPRHELSPPRNSTPSSSSLRTQAKRWSSPASPPAPPS